MSKSLQCHANVPSFSSLAGALMRIDAKYASMFRQDPDDGCELPATGELLGT